MYGLDEDVSSKPLEKARNLLKVRSTKLFALDLVVRQGKDVPEASETRGHGGAKALLQQATMSYCPRISRV